MPGSTGTGHALKEEERKKTTASSKGATLQRAGPQKKEKQRMQQTGRRDPRHPALVCHHVDFLSRSARDAEQATGYFHDKSASPDTGESGLDSTRLEGRCTVGSSRLGTGRTGLKGGRCQDGTATRMAMTHGLHAIPAEIAFPLASIRPSLVRLCFFPPPQSAAMRPETRRARASQTADWNCSIPRDSTIDDRLKLRLH